jgi:N-acetyl sugar amidotransferase
MKYCINCLQPDTRPNIIFTNESVCPACTYHETINSIDWDERFEILTNIIKNYKKQKKKGQFFDCIIGVSGGKDSTRQALWVRDKLGLKPLLVCLSYPPDQVTERGSNNLSNLINLGFDVLISSLAPQTWKKMLTEGFNQFSNWAKGNELALFSSVPQIAIKHKINLIFWGENPALQLGDMKSLGVNGYDGNNLKFLNTLQGGNIDWLINSGIGKEFLIPYVYPSTKEFENSNIQIIYLGWFWKDWSIVNNGMHSSLNGLEIRKDGVENTGDFFGISALDEDWVTLNQMIKYYKFGFGKVTDFVNEEIRMKKMTRDEAIGLVKKYDHSCSDNYIQDFCNYIEISPEQFWDHVKQSVNKKLFLIDENGYIKSKFKVGIGL